MYYDRDGKQIDIMTWAKLFEDIEYKRVALDKLSNGKRISTVWLGMDHNYFGGEPLIFETMVFDDVHDDLQDLDLERYSTLDEAVAGHKEMVKKYSYKTIQ